MPHDVMHDGTTEHVPDEEYRKGPPGDQDWAQLGVQEKQTRWENWFKLGGKLTTIKSARSVEEAIRTEALLGQQGAPMQQYGQLPVVAENFDVPVSHTYAGMNHQGTPTESVDVPLDQFEAGPRDANGDLDPTFHTKSDAAKRQEWMTAMSPPAAGGHGYRPVHDAYLGDHKKLLIETRVRLDANPYPHLDTSLQKLSVWGGKNPVKATALGSGLSLMLAGGFGVGMYYLIRYLMNQKQGVAQSVSPDAPTNVVTTGTSSSLGNTVSVTWDFAKGTGPAPKRFFVVIKSTTDMMMEQTTIDAGSRTAEFKNVQDGNWTASVFAEIDPGTRSEPASSKALTLPVPKTNTGATAPGKPTNVQLREFFSEQLATRVIRVTWDAPTGLAPDEYQVSISALGNPYISAPKTTRNEYVYAAARESDALAPGAYLVQVEAFKDDNASGRTSAVSINFVGKASAVPGVPAGVQTRTFVPEGKSKSSVTVLWDAPPVSDEVTKHAVSITPSGGGAAATKFTADNAITFDDISDGTYTVEVQAVNTLGAGKAASAAVTVKASTDSANIDWPTVLGSDLEAKWKNMGKALRAADEDTEFWPNLMPILKQPTGTGSTPASFAEQAILVKLLTSWILKPAKPVDALLVQRANDLRALTKPPFPATPPAANAGYAGDQLVLWTEAQNLVIKSTGARVVLRTRLFAIEKALHDYLGYEEPPQLP